MSDESGLNNKNLYSKFGFQLLALRKIILDGLSYYIVWQALNEVYEKPFSLKDKGVWWRYRGFLAPTRNALLWSTLLQFSKVFDTHPKTVSLYNLLAILDNNQEVLAPFAPKESLLVIDAEVLTIGELSRKLTRFRNKRVAHFESDSIENLELPPDELNTLVEGAKSIFNLMKYAHLGEYDDFADIMEKIGPHTTQVLEKISNPD